MQHAPRPAYDPVTIWHKTCTLSWAALEDVEDVPDNVERQLGLAEAHAQPEKGRLAGRRAVAVLGGPQPRGCDRDDLLRAE